MQPKPEYQQNTAFIFIPFSFQVSYRDTCENAGWMPVKDDMKYLFRYVSDKLVNDEKQKSQCMHYMFSDDARLAAGLGPREARFVTSSSFSEKSDKPSPHRYQGKRIEYLFRMPSLHLFLFSSGIGIAACQVVFDEDDPYLISSALFRMKQVGRVHVASAETPAEENILLDMVGKLIPDEMKARFFFFSSSRRANVLIHIGVPDETDCDRKVFYLQNCYGDGFPYTEYDRKKTAEETLVIGTHHWGVSSEAVVGVTIVDPEHEHQITQDYYPNFETQYLFLYVFLLHQKYGLYRFLTHIGKDLYTDRAKLEQYRTDLYEFQTDYIYTTVTDVPQYQLLYERISDVFNLKGNYQDVREPLEFLTEIRREEADNEEHRRDRYTNAALFLLSLLSLFSALVDSWDFIGAVPDLLQSSPLVFAFRVLALACIVGITVVMTVLLIKGGRKRK